MSTTTTDDTIDDPAEKLRGDEEEQTQSNCYVGKNGKHL